MLHSEMNKGESIKVGNGLEVTMLRKNADGTATFSLTAKPGASFTFTNGSEQAQVLVGNKDGARAKLSIDAPRSVAIEKRS